jgi:hypothetical protein
VLVVYLLTVIAALGLIWGRGRRPLPLAILAVGVLVLGYVLRDTFTPLPAGPFRWVAIAAVISLLVGIGFTLIPDVHRRLRASPLLRATAIGG